MKYLMRQNQYDLIQELNYLRERIFSEISMLKRGLTFENVASIKGVMEILKKYKLLITPVLEKFKKIYLS